MDQNKEIQSENLVFIPCQGDRVVLQNRLKKFESGFESKKPILIGLGKADII